MRFPILAGTMSLLLASGAQAAVIGSGPAGFQVQETVRIAAPPDRVWAAIVKPGDWWNPEHTYSHDSGNLTLAAVAGGCWCEKWAGGSVEHMIVVHAKPGKMLRLRGGLGPLQEMGVTGAMTWTLTATIDGGTVLTLNYAVGGYSPNGFDGLARAVDGVLAEQVNRLQMFVQTGSPNATATR